MMNGKQNDPIYQLAAHKNRLSSCFYEVSKIWKPERFQGSRSKKHYFEGWYFKNVSACGQHSWSFIPGVSLVGDNAHAFVQVINGSTGKTFYFKFNADDFFFSKDGFQIRIANNRFSNKGFSLDLDDGVNRFSGSAEFSEVTAYRAGLKRPGIMGWYRYVPFMECYHGVVSLDHQLHGAIRYNGEEIVFDDGRGYIEKDWGSSMPKAWIWMQCNHFDIKGTSFMMSVARIPWIGKTFTGFLGFFHYNGQTFTFATYTGAKINGLNCSSNSVSVTIETKEFVIVVFGKNKGTGALKAPVLGEMERVIHESINAEIKLRVSDHKGNLIFEGMGYNSGLELVGDLDLLK
jgi:tocopherol cyclase